MLSLLADVVGQPESVPGKAEAELRLQRNNQSHLHRVPEPELVEISKRLGEALDRASRKPSDSLPASSLCTSETMLSTASRMKRRVVFDLLRGASVVFDRSVQVVDREIPRQSLGLGSGTGDSSTRHSAPGCTSITARCASGPRVFLFNRCEGGKVTFVAMETGHAWESEKHSSLFSKPPWMPPTAT